MPYLTKQKVVAYITRERNGQTEVLVFDHADSPDAGTQVPAGTVDPDAFCQGRSGMMGAERRRRNPTMPRPTVLLNCFTSIDGRLTTAPGRNVNEWTASRLDGQANLEAHKLYDELDCDALLSGSETCVVFGSHPVESSEPSYWPQKAKAFIVVDGQGRIDWAQTDTLIVITRENANPAYLDQLQRKQVRTIQAGRGEHVDLHLALEALYAMGFRRIGLSGGGGINGAFLRAGLIDEIHLLLAPLAVGGRRTPTLFDAPDLEGLDGATRLDLVDVKLRGEGAVHLHYRVVR